MNSREILDRFVIPESDEDEIKIARFPKQVGKTALGFPFLGRGKVVDFKVSDNPDPEAVYRTKLVKPVTEKRSDSIKPKAVAPLTARFFEEDSTKKNVLVDRINRVHKNTRKALVVAAAGLAFAAVKVGPLTDHSQQPASGDTVTSPQDRESMPQPADQPEHMKTDDQP